MMYFVCKKVKGTEKNEGISVSISRFRRKVFIAVIISVEIQLICSVRVNDGFRFTGFWAYHTIVLLKASTDAETVTETETKTALMS